jgi:hypothetical protein
MDMNNISLRIFPIYALTASARLLSRAAPPHDKVAPIRAADGVTAAVLLVSIVPCIVAVEVV